MRACWPIGTRQRVWLDVLVYTGLRRGDAVRFGRQHIRNGVGTHQDGEDRHRGHAPDPAGADEDTATPDRAATLTFIAGESGQPTRPRSRSAISFARRAAKPALQNRSAHGLRKAAATRAAENGATVAQLNAIFGWKGSEDGDRSTPKPPTDDDYHSMRCTMLGNDK